MFAVLCRPVIDLGPNAEKAFFAYFVNSESGIGASFEARIMLDG